VEDCYLPGTPAIAHFDNSPNNQFNPNPKRTVYYGEMTGEEMMLGFFSVVVDASADPKKILLQQGQVVPTGGE
jgi:hypothetical protein